MSDDVVQQKQACPTCVMVCCWALAAVTTQRRPAAAAAADRRGAGVPWCSRGAAAIVARALMPLRTLVASREGATEALHATRAAIGAVRGSEGLSVKPNCGRLRCATNVMLTSPRWGVAPPALHSYRGGQNCLVETNPPLSTYTKPRPFNPRFYRATDGASRPRHRREAFVWPTGA